MISKEQINFSRDGRRIRAARLQYALGRPLIKLALKTVSIIGFVSILGIFAILITGYSVSIIVPAMLKVLFFAGTIAAPIYIFIKNYFYEVEAESSLGGAQDKFDIFKISDFEVVRLLSKVNADTPDIHGLFGKLLGAKRVGFILTEAGINEPFLQKIASGIEGQNPKETLFSSLVLAIENALAEKEQFITSADLFYGILKTNPNLESALLSLEMDETDLSNIVFWANNLFAKILYPKRMVEKMKMNQAGLAETWTSGYTVFLDRFSFDITNPRYFGGFSVEGRENILSQMENILSKDSKNNLILTGETGTGKTILVYGFAEKIYWGNSLPSLAHKRVVCLDSESLVASTSDPGEIAERLMGVLNEAAKAGNVILFIDNIHTLLAGGDKVGSIDASEILAPYLEASPLTIIGVTTTASYETFIAPRQHIAGAFEKIEVPPTDLNQTIRILEDLSLYYSGKFGVRITYDALKEIYRLADRFVANKDFPARAVDVLSNVISAAKNTGEKTLDKGAVDKLSEAILNIPVQQASGEEKEKLLRLEEQLHSRVIGQEAAVRAVSDALRRARTQVADNKRPIGSFLFLGPTGVGKTELSKALAWAYFGSPDNMIRMDMSEFQQVGAIERFVGKKIPGSETLEGGDLVKRVREKPFSVVLLDEIEKAHPDILNLFLQVLDEGYLTDGMGAKVNFSNSIIIATSNAGANLIREGVAKGEDIETLKTNLLNQLQSEGIYRPEFLNRFDGTIIFKPLTKEELLKIAGLMFAKTTQDMKDKGYILEIEQPALEKLVEWGYQPEFGARPMRRVFQDKLESMLAKKILEESIKKGQPFIVKLSDLEETGQAVGNA